MGGCLTFFDHDAMDLALLVELRFSTLEYRLSGRSDYIELTRRKSAPSSQLVCCEQACRTPADEILLAAKVLASTTRALASAVQTGPRASTDDAAKGIDTHMNTDNDTSTQAVSSKDSNIPAQTNIADSAVKSDKASVPAISHASNGSDFSDAASP
eukprot:1121469-Pleurochrysis_carterae.AAC.2